MLSRAFFGLVLIASLFLVGCSETPTGPNSNDASILAAGASVPKLLRPVGTSIEQNTSSSGCPDAGVRGKGFLIHFDWTDSEPSEAIASYQIRVQRKGAKLPLVNLEVVLSEFVFQGCGFVIDSNLKDWEWRVRVQSQAGALGDWSQVGLFEFKPCRLSDGSRCRTN